MRKIFIPVFFFFSAVVLAQPGIINTVVGSGQVGSQGNNGDGGPATAAKMDYPMGVTCDKRGNYYLHDAGYIRIIDPSGIINTISGMSSNYVSCDKAGSLYYGNTSLYKKDTLGNITHIAGGGSSLGDGGPALQAQFQRISSVAFDGSGNIYVCDYNDHRVRKIDQNGIITTYAGTGTAGYSGNGGLANQAKLNYPYRVATDQAGNLYVADSYNNVIRKVSTTDTISTVAGNGYGAGGSPGSGGYNGDGMAATSAMLNFPMGLAFTPSGEMIIADQFNGRIRKVTQSGIISTIAGTCGSSGIGDGGPAYSSCLSTPDGVDVDPAGNIFVCDYGHARVREINSFTTGVSSVASSHTIWFSNPVTDKLMIHAMMGKPVKIWNSLGELIYTETACCETLEVDMSGKPAGVYLLQVGEEMSKIVKQ